MSTNLNLARKWRSKSFDQIVGQILPVRMLKNSLYLDNYFPVYLFSGQRGCGKTSMARVFASSINCALLPEFQKNPKSVAIPCLNCPSCSAMQSGKHPDFIEIDAASYTGVDNVRHIIDVASLLPVLGRKKIYLIDEAHMLSKAAFNAFLKILEEPPASVVFILATTDAQKIIDTVKSRCFQLFFTPIDEKSLSAHLATICQTENIQFEESALQLIVKTTDGSARDAINLLEAVRFSAGSVNKKAVLNVLGHFDDERLIALFKVLLFNDPAVLLKYIHSNNLSLHSAQAIWQKLIEVARASLWIKHGVEPHLFVDHLNELKKIVSECSINQLHGLLDIFYNNESLFLKTSAQHGLLEMILLKICQKNGSDNAGSSSAPQNAAAPESCDDENRIIVDEDEEVEDDEDEESENEEEEEEASDTISFLKPWNNFLKSIISLHDPLLNSVFTQGKPIQFDTATKKLTVEFSKELSFFNDWLNDSSASWKPLLEKSFDRTIEFCPHFTGEQKKTDTKKTVPVAPIKTEQHVKSAPTPKQSTQPTYKNYNTYTAKKFSSPKENLNPRIDISDAATWQKAHMLLKHFPGTIREMRENL